MSELFTVRYFNLESEDVFNQNILAYNIYHALGYITEYLDRVIGEDKWHILNIKNKINFIDATNEDEEDGHLKWEGDVECPACAINHTVLDKILKFNCQCGNEITLADNGWIAILCKQCGNRIERTEIIRDTETGKLSYIKDDSE